MVNMYHLSFPSPLAHTCCIYFFMKLMLLDILQNTITQETQYLGYTYTALWNTSDHLILKMRLLKSEYIFLVLTVRYQRYCEVCEKSATLV